MLYILEILRLAGWMISLINYSQRSDQKQVYKYVKVSFALTNKVMGHQTVSPTNNSSMCSNPLLLVPGN